MKFQLFVGVFIIALNLNSALGAGATATWSYSETEAPLYGPSNWGKENANCDGQRQSPINVVTTTAVPAKRTTPVRTEGSDKVPVTTTYKNDGHGFAAKVVYSDGSQPSVTGGPLGADKYSFVNFHIHWPSEHTLDGKHFAAELHVVHYNLKYGSFDVALTKPDGLAVVGVFLELKPESTEIRPLFAATTNIKTYDSSYTETTKNFPLRQFYQNYRNLNVYSYLGSLTTPTCNEAVTWLVSKNPIPISQAELDLVKMISNDHGSLVDLNNRPVQNLNGRVLTRYF